jgi:hypothetical protein
MGNILCVEPRDSASPRGDRKTMQQLAVSFLRTFQFLDLPKFTELGDSSMNTCQ